MTLRPSSLSPIAEMRSPVIATSARRGGAPVPSTTNPPRITMSASTSVPLVVPAIVPRTGPTHNHQRSVFEKPGESGHPHDLADVDDPRAIAANGERCPISFEQ